MRERRRGIIGGERELFKGKEKGNYLRGKRERNYLRGKGELFEGEKETGII